MNEHDNLPPLPEVFKRLQFDTAVFTADQMLAYARAALAAAQPPIVTPYNVGRWCMSEDECRTLGVDFASYERGVADAAEAFGRTK